jgi:hypothetical protein
VPLSPVTLAKIRDRDHLAARPAVATSMAVNSSQPT